MAGSRQYYLLLVFLVCSALVACSVMVACTVAKTYFEDSQELVESMKRADPAAILLTASSFLLIAIFVSLAAIFAQHYITSIVFLLILVFVAILSVAGTSWAFVERQDVTSYLEGEMSYHQQAEVYNKYVGHWDYVHLKYDCCGSTGPDSWQGLVLSPNVSCSAGNSTTGVPASCCVTTHTTNTTANTTTTTTVVRSAGCSHLIEDILDYQLQVLGGLGLVLCITQAVGIALGIQLCQNIRGDDRRKRLGIPLTVVR